MEELAESSSGRFIKFPEDSFELDNCLLSPKLIKSQGETEKKREKAILPNPSVHLQKNDRGCPKFDNNPKNVHDY